MRTANAIPISVPETIMEIVGQSRSNRDMPIIAAVAALLHGDADVRTVIAAAAARGMRTPEGRGLGGFVAAWDEYLRYLGLDAAR